jgi:hypothetical protein
VEEYNVKLCDERHDKIAEEFLVVWKRMNGTEKKLWAIILLLVANLAGMIGMFIKGN